MKIKLPENFGGLSLNGDAVKLKADKQGCVRVKDGDVALALLAHGGTAIEEPTDAAPESDGEGEGTKEGEGGGEQK